MQVISSILHPGISTTDEEGNSKHLDWFTPMYNYPYYARGECEAFKFSNTEVINLDVLFNAFNGHLHFLVARAEKLERDVRISEPTAIKRKETEDMVDQLQKLLRTKPIIPLSMNNMPGGYAPLQEWYDEKGLVNYHNAVRDASSMVCELEKNGVDIGTNASYLQKINDTIVTLNNFFNKYQHYPTEVTEEHCFKEEGTIIDVRMVYTNLSEMRAIIKMNIFRSAMPQVCKGDREFRLMTEAMPAKEQIDYFYDTFLKTVSPHD